MTHRQPTRHDIGRTVEVSMDNQYWIEGRLVNINAWQFSDDDVEPPVVQSTYWLRGNSVAGPYYYCRIPIDPTSAADQLAVAADLTRKDSRGQCATRAAECNARQLGVRIQRNRERRLSSWQR